MQCTFKEVGSPLPPKQEFFLLQAFEVVRNCKFDSSGENLDWKNMEVEHRARIKKFFKDSNPQMKDIEESKLTDFCKKLKAKVMNPEEMIKFPGTESN